MLDRISKVVSIMLAVILVAVNSAAALAAAPEQQTDQTIVDIAVADGRFTTLVTALQAADLVDTLSGDGPFTVFAPTDDAFAALPAGTIDSLLADVPTLTNVLLYHVVPGKVLAADVVKLPAADTVLGQPVNISVDGSTVRVNKAQVIITDIEASNGVIHVIDAVLLPPTTAPDKSYQTPPSTKGNDQSFRYGRRGYRGFCTCNQYGSHYGRGYYGPRSYNRGYYTPRSYNRGYTGYNRYGRGYHGRGYYSRNYYNRGYYGYGRHGHGGSGYGYRYR